MTSHSSKPDPVNGQHKLVEEGSVDDEDSSPAECGIGGFKPAFLQRCASMPAFTGFYSLCALMTSTLLSYVNSQVTTLERHFGFSSTETGLIMAANDVGFLVIILFVSFIASKVHIPRALGLFSILFGVSGIICALPQFLFGAPSPMSSSRGDVMGNVSNLTSTKPSGSFGGQICDGDNHTSLNCDAVLAGPGAGDQAAAPEDRARAHAGAALAIILGGMFLQGIAKTPRSSFVTVYVDDNVEKVKTGFYMGIIIAIGIMGPAAAFALGGLFTRIYVTLEETDMHYRHPKWIGAWWLGYLIFGAAAGVVAIPLFFFPSSMKRRQRKKEPSKAATPSHASATKRLADFIKSFSSAMRRLLTNPVYMCTVLSSCSLLFSVAGGHSFTPKYIENQFAFPAWKANMSMAGVMLGTACVGTFVGGYLTKKLQMGPLTSLKFTIAMTFLATSFKVLLLFFHCPQPYLHNSPGPRAAAVAAETAGCADMCGCDDNDFFPVCGQDGRSFFSPCHAGCRQAEHGSYVNCTCIEGGRAMAGLCDYSCPMFYPFLVCLCISALLGTLAIIPKVIIYIRSVEERDKPLALGFTSFMFSVTGWMLGPICFGKLVDGICIQWEHSCTGSGACRLYDNDDFRLKLLGYQALFRVGALLLVILAYVSARLTNKFETSPQQPASEKAEAMRMVEQGKEDKHLPVAGDFADPD